MEREEFFEMRLNLCVFFFLLLFSIYISVGCIVKSHCSDVRKEGFDALLCCVCAKVFLSVFFLLPIIGVPLIGCSLCWSFVILKFKTLFKHENYILLNNKTGILEMKRRKKTV